MKLSTKALISDRRGVLCGRIDGYTGGGTRAKVRRELEKERLFVAFLLEWKIFERIFKGFARNKRNE